MRMRGVRQGERMGGQLPLSQVALLKKGKSYSRGKNRRMGSPGREKEMEKRSKMESLFSPDSERQ